MTQLLLFCLSVCTMDLATPVRSIAWERVEELGWVRG